jgi:hypothetical protein
MERLSILVLVLIGAVSVGAQPASARTDAGRKGAEEPLLGNWSSGGSRSSEVTLQVQRVKTEIQVDNGDRVTVTRGDYFQLTALKFGDVHSACPSNFGDVLIRNGSFNETNLSWLLRGEVVNPTTIHLDMFAKGSPCLATGSRLLHPVSPRHRPAPKRHR